MAKTNEQRACGKWQRRLVNCTEQNAVQQAEGRGTFG